MKSLVIVNRGADDLLTGVIDDIFQYETIESLQEDENKLRGEIFLTVFLDISVTDLDSAMLIRLHNLVDENQPK